MTTGAAPDRRASRLETSTAHHGQSRPLTKDETMTTTSNRKQRTITLTDRPPVRITDDEWPQIASASWHDGAARCQADNRLTIKVRQHADGRTLVYGVCDSALPDRDARAGYLLLTEDGTVPSGAIITAIRYVASEIGRPELAALCIADLPAEEI